MFDGEKRQVFAARDSSGSEPLFYELDDDGALSLSNSQPAVPADVGFVQVGAGRCSRCSSGGTSAAWLRAHLLNPPHSSFLVTQAGHWIC